MVMKTIRIGNDVLVRYDENCYHCQSDIESIRAKIGEVYRLNERLGEESLPAVIIKLTPDVNSAGVITHFHIELVDEV